LKTSIATNSLRSHLWITSLPWKFLNAPLN